MNTPPQKPWRSGEKREEPRRAEGKVKEEENGDERNSLVAKKYPRGERANVKPGPH